MGTETGKSCPNCGKALKEGAAFCTNCGAAVGAAADAPGAGTERVEREATQSPTPPAPAAAPVPPGPPAAGVEGGEMPAAEYAPAPPPRKSRTALIIGVLGGLLIVAGIVVLVLWLTMWRDGKAGGTDDPIALAEKYMSALERKDVDAYFDCFKEDFLEDNPIMEGMGMDMKELMEMTFKMMEVRFDDYALEVESERGSEATVVTTRGKATMSVMGFEENIDLADDPMVFEMVKEGGRWYLTQDPMPTASMGGDMGLDGEDLEFDLEDMEDFDLEDMEELLPEDMEDLEQFLPEGFDLQDLEDMSPEDLEKMLEELEKMFEDMPVGEESTT